MNVLAFMMFFMLVFGILGIENFKGTLQHRCIVDGPAPSGYISLGKQGARLATNFYTRNDTAYFDGEGSEGNMGEFELWCGRDGKGVSCPSNMFCKYDFGNPHFGFAGFDDFYQA